jgi:hypothetical protein
MIYVQLFSKRGAIAMRHLFNVPEIKELVLAAADLHEDSYLTETSSYRLDYQEAADLACKLLNVDPELSPMIGLALSGWWNDVLEWAGDHDGRVPTMTVPADFVYPVRTGTCFFFGEAETIADAVEAAQVAEIEAEVEAITPTPIMVDANQRYLEKVLGDPRECVNAAPEPPADEVGAM